MLIAIDYENSFTISELAMEKAVIKIDRLLNGFREFVNEEVTFSKYQATRKRVLEYIKNKGEVKRKDLLQGLKMTSKDLQTVLTTLIEEETIHMRPMKSGNNKTAHLYSVNGK